MHQKSGSSRPVSFRINLLFLQGIPTLALSKSGSRSKVTPSSQPVIQAPVCLIFINMVIHHYEGNYNLVYRKRCRNSRTQGKTGKIPSCNQELSILIPMAQVVSKTCAIYIYYNNLKLLCPFIRIILWKSD